MRKVVLLLTVIAVFTTGAVFAQNVLSGEITGVVSDPTGAVVANATVTVTGKEMGVTQTQVTGSTGSYRFPLVRPGQYTISAQSTGFAKSVVTATVSLGTVSNIPITLQVGTTGEVVEVTSTAPLLETETANLVTNYNSKQIELLPSPGQDITNYVLMSPGTIPSTGGGYGNYTAFGLPGTSNTYTLNGNDMNDPFNNLNNSGASNNMLGANEVQELTVVSNGYTGQYGRGAGANVDITTKSGGNSFHGNARWDYNSTGLNGNEWFNKQAGNPTPHEVSNQWAGSFGGPIKKNKLFFFFDSEGLRYVLPGAGGFTYIPTAAFQTYVLGAIPASEVPFYQKAFALYNGTPGAAGATAVSLSDQGGCGGFAASGFGTTRACANQLVSAQNSLNKERLMSIRVDYEATSKDRLSFRYWQDRGVQATGTDPINAVFSANSVQPQDAGQMSWTRTIKSNLVNQFIASGMYYQAIFGPPNIAGALAAFPTTWIFNDGNMSNLGGTDYNYPQGRKVAQYQFIDDLAWTRGNHGFKFGANLRRNNVGDYTPGVLTSGEMVFNDMNDFVTGNLATANAGSFFRQRFARLTDGQMSWYTLGIYAQDEWRATSKLKLTFALRLDRNSNQACRNNCYSELTGDFATMNHSASVPYNQAIQNGLSESFPSIEKVVWQPRFGFAYQVKPNSVLRGGIGIFSDLYPGQLGHNVITNAPNVSDFSVTNQGLVAPGAGSAVAAAAADNAAFQSAFASGGTITSIKAALPVFTAPNFIQFPQHLLNPRYTEWNLEYEQGLGSKTSLRINYVGNHGSNLLVLNRWANAYNAAGLFGLPTAPVDTRFGQIQSYTNAGTSNYNGLTTTLTRRLTHGFTGGLSYTWSHSLDDVSNGGIQQYDLSSATGSILNWLNPASLRSLNYASSDYDFRHTLGANYTWELPFKSANGILDRIVGGWAIAGTMFVRSAIPYGVINTTARGKISNFSGGTVMANWLGGTPASCNSPSDTCLTTAEFTPRSSQTTLGSTPRNFFRGPGYFDSDFSLLKNIRITESGLTFSFGANAFNVFNHPNFGVPYNSLTLGGFGTIQNTAVGASSPYGNFQGGFFGRLLQLEMKVKF